MVKDHSDSEKGNLLPPHRLLFTINSKGSFICIIPQTGQHMPQPLLHQSRIDPTTHHTMSERSYHGATSCSRSDSHLWAYCYHYRVLLLFVFVAVGNAYIVLSHHVDVLVGAVEVHVLVYLRCFESSRRCAGVCC